MAFTIPENLPESLYPLAWLIGILYSPGKGMSDAAVYQWMFDKYDMPKDVLVGTLSRKQTYGG